MLAGVWFGVDLASPSVADHRPKGLATVAQALPGPQDLAVKAVSLDEVRLMIDVTNKELSAATAQLEAAQVDLTAATAATDELQSDADEMGQQTLSNAIASYQLSEIPTALLATGDVNDAIRKTTLGDVAVTSDFQSFEKYRNLKKDLEIEESELQLRTDRLAAAQATIDRLNHELGQELAVLGDLEERRLQNQATSLSAQASVRSQYKGKRQGYYLDTCPVDGSHNFIDSWGFARSGGRRHEGVDIMSKIGTPVVAPVSGTVELRDNSLGGKSFHLTGDDGNYYYGTHLSRYGKSGQVKVGEVIGYVGDTGNARGIPHLHFEIHPGGRSRPAINPFIDSAAVCSGAKY